MSELFAKDWWLTFLIIIVFGFLIGRRLVGNSKKMSGRKFMHDNSDKKIIGLQTFFMNFENNHFDFAINNLIKEHEKRIAELKLQIESDHKEPGYMKFTEIEFLKRELVAVCEMKILYGYKHFETHLKWLLRVAYPTEMNEIYIFRWHNVEKLLKSKDIDPKLLSNYNELRDLRNISNAIKHSLNPIGNKTKNIKEFLGKTELNYKDLLKFYGRVEVSGLIFLQSLSEKIIKL